MNNHSPFCLLKPGLKLTVRRRSIVLVEDLVSDQFPGIKGIVPLSYKKNTAIFCSLKNLNNVREEFPSLPAYGIWQLIFASIPNLSEPLYAIYFDQGKKNGQFLLKQGDGFFSGRIVNGKPLGMKDDIDLETATLIELAAADLCLPDAPALTAQERDHLNNRRKKETALILGIGIVAGILLFVSVSYWLDGYQRQYEKEKVSLLNELNELEAQRDLLASNRIRRWPDQWNIFYPLARLANEGVDFAVPGTDMEKTVLRARLIPDLDTEQATVPQWMYSLPRMHIQYLMDGSVWVSWLNQNVLEVQE